MIGHPLTLDLLPTGMRIARTALRLRKAGVLSGSPVVVADELDTIIANRDEWLLETLRAQVLQPLRELPDGKRDRLVETLRSWLWNMGDRHAVADDLHIHPQTVRYRMDRLHDLLGSAWIRHASEPGCIWRWSGISRTDAPVESAISARSQPTSACVTA